MDLLIRIRSDAISSAQLQELAQAVCERVEQFSGRGDVLASIYFDQTHVSSFRKLADGTREAVDRPLIPSTLQR